VTDQEYIDQHYITGGRLGKQSESEPVEPRMKNAIHLFKLYYRAGNGILGSACIAFKTLRKSK